MALALIVLCAFVLVGFVWRKRTMARREMERYSITAEGLHRLLASNAEVLVYDVRQPLDLFAESEIIPGAQRLAPKELLENPALIPREMDSVVYCTCPTDKTSRAVLHRALSLGFFRIKFLQGGLEAWKAKGYRVEPYEEPFRLDTGT